MIPEFRNDGCLPTGLHLASEAEVTFRFGSSSPRRRRLILRLRRWLELARATRSRRFLLDGSFVTSVSEPKDVDAVVLISSDFSLQLVEGNESALQLESMLLSRSPEELFAAEDVHDWNDWVEFFSRTRETDGRRKGLVEIEL